MDANLEMAVPALVARFEIEVEERVRMNILEALEKLFSQDLPKSVSLRETYAPFFRSVVEGKLSHNLRYQGACAGLMAAKGMLEWRSVKEDEISPQTAPMIIEHFWRSYTHFRNYYTTEKYMLKIMLLPQPVPLLWEILHDIRLQAEDQLIVLRGLLHARFQRRWASHYPKIGPFFDAQQDHNGRIFNRIGVKQRDLKGDSLLKDIVDDDSLWHHKTNIFSYFLGLPDDREQLRAFLNNDKDQP
jgi:hypothetical protein